MRADSAQGQHSPSPQPARPASAKAGRARGHAYAIIAVNARVHGGGSPYRPPGVPAPLTGEGPAYPGPVFHYDVPPALAEALRPGVLVEVPFGPRQVQGLIVSLAARSPVSETRPVTRALLEGPVLTQGQIALGLWLSEYYRAPLIDCLRLMLPPGLLRQPRAVVRLHPEVPVPDELSPAEAQVVDLLQRYDTLSRSQIARRLGRAQANRAVRSLRRRGVLIRSSDLPTPRPKPKRVSFVCLTASPPQVAGARPLLGHPSKQADVLTALLEDSDPLPSTDSVLARAEATTATLATLERKGFIERIAERRLVLAMPAVEEADLSRAPSQAAVVETLRQRSSPMERGALLRETGVSPSTLRTLEGRGLVRQVTEPSTVLLRLVDQQVRQQIVELRGSARQNQVLDYLLSRKPGEWVWVSWVYAETDCELKDLRALEALGLIALAEREVWRDPLADKSFALQTPPRLTPDQEEAWAAVRQSLSEPPPSSAGPRVFLLHGVTGSGKTEIYMRAAEAALQQGRQAIVLVPEISLTPQTIGRFAARFSSGLGITHSTLSDGERYDTWRRIGAGHIRLLIGPRSALFAPLDDVGLIVLDEEHDASYKQDDTPPTYHARQVALHIAEAQGAVVLLGSATPDLSTYYQARETGEIRLLELPQRILQHRRYLEKQRFPSATPQARFRSVGPGYDDVVETDLPPVHVIDMRHELRVGNRSIFSRVLQHEMKRALAAGEQIILFLNRRGAFTFVMCRDCGTVIRCPRCDIPLTFHLKSEQLTCHHCNFQRPAPQVCPICHSPRIKYFGTGTQRVEQAVHGLFPSARVLRWDRDTTRGQASHEALLDRFMRHQADVLIGTQMIAKGLDLPLVTLVGVVSADTALNLPDFRAAERTFQLLTQVAGRVGRGPQGGQAIVQTYMPQHYAVQAAAGHDYAAFYRQERAFRQQLGYPPFARLARLVFSDADPRRCRVQAQALYETLRQAIHTLRLDQVTLIGPAPCFFGRLRGRWRWQIVLREPCLGVEHHPLARSSLHQLLDHVALPPGWRLDVDPLDML